MIEHHLELASAEGAMNTFVVYPEENGPFPVVLFYMDAPGKREELHDMARRLASVGYFVVLPNLYYRRSQDYYLKERTPEQMAIMYEHMGSLNYQTNHMDTQAMLDFVDQHPQADAGRIGAVGYCMSGPFVMWAAADFPDRFKCIASIHGANMVTEREDSPHLMPPKIRCESYFACAEIDHWAPPEDMEKLESALRAANNIFRLEWFAKAEHGFVFPKRPAYLKPAAERHWEQLFNLFRRNLG